MITDYVVQQVLDNIKTWKSEGKIIIGIEGYSGAGKSTLLKMLKEKDPNILPVHRDDFLRPRDEFQALMANTTDRGQTLEYETVDVEEIIAFAEKFRRTEGLQTFVLRADESMGNNSGEKNMKCTYDFSKKIMIIEGIWLFHPKLYDHIFDYRILLDTDQDAADERRRQREMKKWGDLYFPDTHPDNYFNHVKKAYNDYLTRYDPKKRADLIVMV